MISISPTTYDISGGLTWQRVLSSSKIESGERRVSRRKLLDQSVDIYDGGYAEGDRTLTLNVKPTAAEVSRMRELCRDYGWVHVSLADGFFLAMIERWDYAAPTLTMSLLLESKLSA
jgi:hypothetical protein